MDILTVTIRLFLSALIGGIIGYERGYTKQPAGLRTHMLICIGACIAMLTNEYIYTIYGSTDITRMGAQVISGIGFLGAGTIILVGKQKVKGLTTAAGLWASACIGLAIGIGFYTGAVIGGVLIFLIIAALHNMDIAMKRKSSVMQLYIQMEDISTIRDLKTYFETHKIHIEELDLRRSAQQDGSFIETDVTIKLPERGDHLPYLLDIIAMNGVIYAQES
ncbi:MAG: MgtC/SapB family protein [Anaerofustis sp.]